MEADSPAMRHPISLEMETKFSTKTNLKARVT